ncbi:hypothetical protein GCM10010503_31170 [Streptomyces lucensis JCM 4490]|uniref:Uncharacterized protein n=1 Tax=Streptomyces lucensis JCM 4490 TaxID=1306176 RepID=A0A918MSB1_9ACTN|nr:hypothetical protein [Streptomyces lucensis]GGW51984.1 hypothetical protein GCM10010503_31170 [Streptomyces lucensis JCM 4490]
MQTRSVVEIARAALREIFPTAPEDGLDEGARHLARWGVEGHGTGLGSSAAALMYMDLAGAAQERHVPDDVIAAGEVRAGTRTWRAPSQLG